MAHKQKLFAYLLYRSVKIVIRVIKPRNDNLLTKNKPQ